MEEKVLKYDKLEATRNKCYPISWKSFIFLFLLTAVILTFLLIILSVFIVKLPEFVLVLGILFVLIGVPLIGLKIYFNKIKWFATALVKKENKLYLVQLINYDFLQDNYSSENVIYPDESIRDDERFIETLNNYINGKKIQGKVFELKNAKILSQNKKQYTLIYNENERKVTISIPKAYIDIEKILEDIKYE